MPTDAFVPLTARTAPQRSQEFRALVVQHTGQAKSLRSPGGMTVTGAVPAVPARSPCEPRVSLERDGDRINRIHIECSCGQVFDLACDYTPPA